MSGRLHVMALVAAWTVLASAPSEAGSTRRPLVDALAVTASRQELAANLQLLARLRASAHGYFRFVNVPFSQAVCEHFQDIAAQLPEVNLHGDAHVEQYAVTSLGRGLTDFDDSSTGPFVIDLVRFGTSLRLAAHAHGWGGEQGAILDAFFRGYRAALRDPSFAPPEPSLVARLRAGFSGDHALSLRGSDSLMGPPAETSTLFREAGRSYVEGLLVEHPELPPTFFDLKKSGLLQMGVGSALDRKMLARVEGPTTSDDDDVLIEAKEVKDISMIGCVTAPPGADRILAGHSRMANQPYRFAGYLRVEGRTYWLHAWPDDYVEVSVSTLRSPRELMELALDAGAQMGRGAPRSLPAMAERPLRETIETALDRHERRIRKEIHAFTNASIKAWERFLRTAPP